jgi:putative thioredoxin
MVINITDIDFKEKVIEKSKKILVVVDFWATWCYPCQMLGPILEEIEKKYKGKFILAKINVDTAPKVSQEYSIMSIPNVKMFRHGKQVSEFVGVLPKEQVKEQINKNLEK